MTCHLTVACAGSQGAVANVRVSELRLGRSKDIAKAARGVWRALSTRDLRLPCTMQGLHIELRLDRQETITTVKPSAQPVRQKAASRWKQVLVNCSIRIGVAVLPALPFRAKDTTLSIQVWTSFAGL